MDVSTVGLDSAREVLARKIAELFARNPHDPFAILGDAALRYDSTEAHNARCVDAALAAIDECATKVKLE